MLRFILKTSMADNVSGLTHTDHRTLDIEIPELESVLTAGGFGPSGYSVTEVIGIEPLPQESEADDE